MLELIVDYLKSNIVASGLIVGSVSGFLLYIIKGIPKATFDTFLKYFSVSLTVRNDDPIFSDIANYVTKLRNNVKHFHYSNDKYEFNEIIYSVDSNRIVTINRITENNQISWGSGKNKVETIIIKWYLTRNTKLITKFVEQLKLSNEDSKMIDVYSRSNDYFEIIKKNKRSINSIYLNGDILDNLLSDIKLFISSEQKEWYVKRGIPYHRGYLFWGPPGTGKSSSILAIASHFNLPIFYCNFSNIRSVSAYNNKMKIVVLEDVDTLNIGNKRDSTDDVDKRICDDKSNVPPEHKDNNNVTLVSFLSLSDVLNVLDGIIAPENCIVIMTSNHPEVLDSALIRPGRCDEAIKFDLLDQNTADRMKKDFDMDDLDVITPISAAALQNELLKARKVL
jgi:chaperone BCS1